MKCNFTLHAVLGASLAFVALAGFVALAAGCSDGSSRSDSLPSVGGSRGVTQGGPADIGRLRATVDRGLVPSPSMLDPIGYFAEHALDLPPATCGADVCMHPALAVAPRFDGGNWTMAFIALSSAVDPSELPRPPLHLVFALERSETTLPAWDVLPDAIAAMAEGLRPDDRVSIVAFDDQSRVIARELPVDAAELRRLLSNQPPRTVAFGAPGAYGGLARASELALETPTSHGARIVLLTSGVAVPGSEERIERLVRETTAAGAGFSVLGFGDVEPWSFAARIGDGGSGTYYYAEDERDLAGILAIEAQTALFPLARDAEIEITPAPGYKVGRVYGPRSAIATLTGVRLLLPALFLGHRRGADDVKQGRRGGGGGFFVELTADPTVAEVGPNAPAFTARFRYTAPASGERVSEEQVIYNALRPGENPLEMTTVFSDAGYGKAFMMLNMYLGTRATLEYQDAGDCARSMGVVDLLMPVVDRFQATYDDLDIAADRELLLDIRDNVTQVCATTPVIPQFAAGCSHGW